MNCIFHYKFSRVIKMEYFQKNTKLVKRMREKDDEMEVVISSMFNLEFKVFKQKASEYDEQKNSSSPFALDKLVIYKINY